MDKSNDGEKYRFSFMTREGRLGWKLPDKENAKTTPEPKAKTMR